MDSLENDHLQEMPQYSFVKHLSQGVPIMQNNIKDSVMVQLREWLATYVSFEEKESLYKDC